MGAESQELEPSPVLSQVINRKLGLKWNSWGKNLCACWIPVPQSRGLCCVIVPTSTDNLLPKIAMIMYYFLLMFMCLKISSIKTLVADGLKCLQTLFFLYPEKE